MVYIMWESGNPNSDWRQQSVLSWCCGHPDFCTLTFVCRMQASGVLSVLVGICFLMVNRSGEKNLEATIPHVCFSSFVYNANSNYHLTWIHFFQIFSESFRQIHQVKAIKWSHFCLRKELAYCRRVFIQYLECLVSWKLEGSLRRVCWAPFWPHLTIIS